MKSLVPEIQTNALLGKLDEKLVFHYSFSLFYPTLFTFDVYKSTQHSAITKNVPLSHSPRAQAPPTCLLNSSH